METVSLSVLERLKLLELLPAQGDFTTLKIVRRLREELSFSEEEHARFGVKVEGERIAWNPKKAKDKSIELGTTAREVIVASLRRASETKQLTLETLPLYERFVGDA